MTEQHLLLSHDGPVSTITINNPARRNALSLAMWTALPDLVHEAERRDETRAIILRGSGDDTFVAGADISEFETLRSNAEDAKHYEKSNIDAFNALRQCKRPTIAMIRGHCLGGGLGLAISCDLRIAAHGSLFGIPAAKLGLAYPPSAVRDIVALVGPAEAKALFFAATPINAERASAIGLINSLTSDEDLESSTAKLAETIARNAPLTLQAAKAAIDAALPGATETEQQRANTLADTCFNSADFAEGRTAFLNKRHPVFTGH
ncbi:enoyl-CoA hydratase [Coralliovum pocilloporae]|uniref:enoyl-CoA hydratase n=1 Tax=Coralliovum pocilloporae TaxID=3066369 RepID=UPI00330773EB